jgi:ribonuclease BN (tRNA processing enzyme)
VPIQRWPGDPNPKKPRLICPPGSREAFRRIVGTWGNDDLIENAFDLEEYGATDKPQIGPLTVEFTSVPHFTETFALRVSSSANGGGFLAYGADSSPNEAVVEFARGADLLMIEATLPRPERTGMRGHLTPREAGEHAKAAGVKRVLLTHMSDEMDELWARREAESGFGGPVHIAQEGAVFTI